MLAASCWGSVESIERKALTDVQRDINSLYFGYVFSGENKLLLETIMVSVRKVYDRYETYQWLESHFAQNNQTEARQRLLTRLVQEAVRHTTSKVMGNMEDCSHPDRPMFHLLQAFSNATAKEESGDVIDWYQNQVLLQRALAEDRTDSMESLIQKAVQNSFKEFPPDPLTTEPFSSILVRWALIFEPLTRVQLGRQLGFILLEMQELFLRGRAFRSLSYKIEQQKQNPEIAGDPAFILYLSSLTGLFNRHETLWRTKCLGSKWREYQRGLAVLFTQAGNCKKYGVEFYQSVGRILDSKRPVR